MAVVFDIVVAADQQRGIGKDNDLPWHLPGDLAHFKRTTTHTEGSGSFNAVVMGRKTWESIPPKYRPLKNRVNVVLSRRESLELPDGVPHCRSIEAALEMLDARDDIQTIFVVGGAAIYTQAISMPECRSVYYTRILSTFDCDAFFPEFEGDFELQSVLSEGEDSGTAYRIEVWRRPEP